MNPKVLIHPSEEGGFWAEAPALPGCVSEGNTFEEAVANIREAMAGWLEVAAERRSVEIAGARSVEIEFLLHGAYRP